MSLSWSIVAATPRASIGRLARPCAISSAARWAARPPPMTSTDLPGISLRSFSEASSSSSSSSSSGGIRGWMESRRQKQEQEKYMEQMERLTTMEELTLQRYKEELERGLNSWGAKLTFMQTKELETAKEIVKVVDSFIDELGPDGCANDLIQMDRLARLKVATAADKTLEEVAIMVSQIQNMDLMQKTLKKRQLEGKSIPPDANSMQAAIKKDALTVMTKEQKEMIKNRQAGMAQRAARRRRKK